MKYPAIIFFIFLFIHCLLMIGYLLSLKKTYQLQERMKSLLDEKEAEKIKKKTSIEKKRERARNWQRAHRQKNKNALPSNKVDHEAL